VTLNMAKETDATKIAAELAANPDLRNADLLLLQEVKDGTAAALGARFGLAVARADVELAILSRYPLRDVEVRALQRCDLVFHTRVRYALSATAQTPWGPLRIVDTHLDTRLNPADRLAQLNGALRASPGAGAVIVAGDFNSNPFFWIDHILPLPAVRSQASRVEEHMTRAGYASAIPRAAATFDYFGMHLDWIWLRGLRAAGSRVYPLAFSDHHACWARVEL
jgi:endonuclease/exonuclease/phosphatase family metal-dependent hydrolase